MDIDLKFKGLQSILDEMGAVLVAFSGGVDSTFLLQVAINTLHDRVLAVTALSETTPAHEKTVAAEYIKTIGVRYLTLHSNEMTQSDFVSNPPDKCYHCKKHRYGELVKIAAKEQIPWVADGENVDDQADYRPGRRAAQELNVRSPLREAGLTKNEIRRLSKAIGLPTWNRPSSACLASRVPYGQSITPEKLNQVDAAETYIRSLGIAEQVRIRHEGETARIEVDPDALNAFLNKAVRNRITSHLKSVGFRYVALDLEGYEMGRLNRTIDMI